MKKIIIGTVVATVIYFAFQSCMWMGGFHNDFTKYSARQDTILNFLNRNFDGEGMYMMPGTDPNSPNREAEEKRVHKESIGKPWAMIFYHKEMKDMSISYLLMGILYSFIACWIAAMVLYHGNFNSFRTRFLVAMALSIFTLSQGVLDEMNWWSFPWHFIKTQVIDLTVGWGLCSIWLAWYVKRRSGNK